MHPQVFRYYTFNEPFSIDDEGRPGSPEANQGWKDTWLPTFTQAYLNFDKKMRNKDVSFPSEHLWNRFMSLRFR